MTAHMAPPGPAAQPAQLAQALAAAAEGVPAELAAVALLTGCGAWLTRPDFLAWFVRVGASPLTGRRLGIIRWQPAIRALRGGQLPCGSGEAAILRIAASLAADVPVELGQAITALDRANLAALAHAILTAGGCRP
ncbi:MAG TPA: hypothetical protein VGJ54_03580 [Streptosporangiaceae bacterium]